MSSHSSSSKMMTVKNRAPAAIQISAEQILREAADRQQVGHDLIEPVIKIHDQEEYISHLRDRRKHFEDNIRYRREHIGNWVKYARFEEDVAHEYERARSVMERALEVDHRSSELWLRYVEMEMRNENINHARNVLDRAIQILPRVDTLWYKYVYMEEMVGDIPKCRAVFQRWMEWMPDDNAWSAYARFETRHGLLHKAKDVWRQYVNAYPCARAFLRYAKWAEQDAHDIEQSRLIYEAALTELEPEEVRHNARLFSQFAAFEERHGEYERARVIYKHAVKLLGLGEHTNNNSSNNNDMDQEDEVTTLQEKSKRENELYKAYINFEKKRGDRQTIEHVIVTRRRAQYQQRVTDDPYDYDGWFEWAKLEQDQQQEQQEQNSSNSSTADASSKAAAAAVRNVYERAVANVPPTTNDNDDDNDNSNNKDHWRRYIYLWIYYAVYEELTNHDLARASKIYETCLSLIPHEKFTFTKIWILAAQVYVRRRDLTAARKLLGKAIGICTNSNNNNKKQEKIFVAYIALELASGEVDRCRAIYANYIKACPTKSLAWNKYAELEKSLGETERCRAIYELAISQPALDMPEMLWKSYIDFEIDEGQGSNARRLYERLLEKTSHVKVWISFAQFEASAIGQGMNVARSTFERAYEQLKEQGLSEERVLLLDAWRLLEKSQPDDGGVGTGMVAENVAKVEARMPRRLKRKRLRVDENGNEMAGCWEEYFDYQFPDDDQGGQAANHFKILEMAAKWKEQQQQQQQQNDNDVDSDDSDSSEDDD